ncbi:hypothetical protein TWF281_000991 [Arthrobotrys megalospora]
MDKINYSPCNERGSKGDEKETLSHKADKARSNGVVIPKGRSASESRAAAQSSNPLDWLDIDAPVVFSSKKSIEMLKYRVKNGTEENYGNYPDDDATTEDDNDLENSGFEFDFENQPERANVKIDDGTSDDGFHRAASITSSCLDSLETAEILTAKEVKLTKASIKDVTLEERTLIRPDDDDLTQALIPKGPKFFETTIHGKKAAQHLLRSLGRVPPPDNQENVPEKVNATPVINSNFSQTPKSSQPRGRRATLGKPALTQTKVTILPPIPFYPPSPTIPPPPPPKDTKRVEPIKQKGFKTPITPWPENMSDLHLNKPTTSPSPSKKYRELNLRPPIPITPLQKSMHLYGSTSTLPFPKTPTQPEEKKHPNFSRRQTSLFGNHLTVPSPDDHNLRRASYNSPSSRSVRLPMPGNPGTQLPPRPGTACDMDRAGSSASVRSSKRERFKNFFKKL